MGREKGALRLGGIRLRERQWALLRELRPAELFLSAQGEMAETDGMDGLTLVPDRTPGQGPLGGIASVLARITTPRLLVLAVDLPLMTASCLRRLITIGRGAIPKNGDRFEPLAAVYPRETLPIAQELLARGSLRLQVLAALLVERGLALPCPILPEERVCFENANTPEEWAAIQRRAGEDSSR